MLDVNRLGLGCLRKLISIGVDPQVRDATGRTPLLWAASAGSTDAILALVNHGADILSCDDEGLSALHCAASRGQDECITSLITLCGADVNKKDNSGCTPLFYAVTLGHGNVSNLLLDSGALTDVQDKKGKTPAHRGAAKGQLDTIRLLSSYKANLWLKNDKGNLPFHDAILSGRKDLVIFFLSQKPEAVHFDNNDGKKPIHQAATLSDSTLCSLLVEFQSEINPIFRSSRNKLMTPLDVALQKGNRDCAKYLQLEGGLPATKLVDKHALKKALERARKEKKLLASDGNKQSASPLTHCSMESTQNDTERWSAQYEPSPDLTSNLDKRSSSETTKKSPIDITRSSSIKSKFNKFPLFSPINFEKSISSNKMSDSDSESDYYTVSRTRRKKVLRKKIATSSSEPHLFSRLDSPSDTEFISMSVGDIARVGQQHKFFPARRNTECFPDIVPSEDKAIELPINIESEAASLGEVYVPAQEMNTIKELEAEDSPAKHEEDMLSSSVNCEGSIKMKTRFHLRRANDQPNMLSRRSIFNHQKLIRKSVIEQALQAELENLHVTMCSAPKIWEGVIVKRLAKEFNTKIQSFVGTKTFNGHLKFHEFEKHILDQLSKFQTKGHLPAVVLNESTSNHPGKRSSGCRFIGLFF